VQLGKLTMDHLDDWERQLEGAGLEPETVSPIILPEYTREVR